jgi:PhnB protein
METSMSTTPKPPRIIPYLFYRDVAAALEFLTRAFGFKEEMRHETPSGGVHTEASFQGQPVMMGQSGHSQGLSTPAEAGAATMGVFIYLDDVDGHYRRPERPGPKSSTRRRMRPTGATTGRRVTPGSSLRRRRRNEPSFVPLTNALVFLAPRVRCRYFPRTPMTV